MNVNYNEFYDCRFCDAKTLPRGWVWIQYYDGSGHLESPDRKVGFHYDLTTYPGDIEWRKTKDHAWGVFYGSFDEFKEYAESVVKKDKEEILSKMPIISELRNKVSRDNRSLLDRAADEIERLYMEKEELKKQFCKEE